MDNLPEQELIDAEDARELSLVATESDPAYRSEFARPDGLSKDGQTAWSAVMGVLMQDKIVDAGLNRQVFHSPSDWTARNEACAPESELIVAHDGGGHAPYFNLDYGAFMSRSTMDRVLDEAGFYIETQTPMCSAVCRRPLNDHQLALLEQQLTHGEDDAEAEAAKETIQYPVPVEDSEKIFVDAGLSVTNHGNWKHMFTFDAPVPDRFSWATNHEMWEGPMRLGNRLTKATTKATGKATGFTTLFDQKQGRWIIRFWLDMGIDAVTEARLDRSYSPATKEHHIRQFFTHNGLHIDTMVEEPADPRLGALAEPLRFIKSALEPNTTKPWTTAGVAGPELTNFLRRIKSGLGQILGTADIDYRTRFDPTLSAWRIKWFIGPEPIQLNVPEAIEDEEDIDLAKEVGLTPPARAKMPSGIEGWQDRLQNVYSGFEEFEAYDQIYDLARRFGFDSPQSAWAANPVIRGSVNPSDSGTVEETATGTATGLTLMHGTSTTHLPVIRQRGLEYPYLTNNPEVAKYYAQAAVDSDGGSPVVLQVRITSTADLRADFPSFEEPLHFVYKKYAHDEKEWYQALSAGQTVAWPKDDNDWQTSLRVVGSVIYYGTVEPGNIQLTEHVEDGDDDRVGIVAVFRENDENGYEVLVAKREVDPEAGSWCLPGGHAQVGEKIEDGTRREMREETRLELDDLTFIKKMRNEERNADVWIYGAILPKGEKPKAGDDAGKLKWVPIDDLPELAFDNEKLIAEIAEKMDLQEVVAESYPPHPPAMYYGDTSTSSVEYEHPQNTQIQLAETVTVSESLMSRFDRMLGEDKASNKFGKNGFLVVFEGVDGGGKTTQCKRLAEWLNDKDYSYIVTKWNSSKLLSDALWKAKRKKMLTPMTFSLLHASDMHIRYQNIILPALKKEKVVLCDRYYYTSYVRDKIRGIDDDLLDIVYKDFRKPDLVFFCEVPVRIAVERLMAERGVGYYSSGQDVGYGVKGIEKTTEKYEEDMQERYEKLFKNEPYVVRLDMARPIKEIAKDIKREMRKRLRMQDVDESLAESVKPLPGDRLVTVKRLDGTTYLASFGGRMWPKVGQRYNVPSIAVPVGDEWSHVPLKDGEEIMEM